MMNDVQGEGPTSMGLTGLPKECRPDGAGTRQKQILLLILLLWAVASYLG